MLFDRLDGASGSAAAGECGAAIGLRRSGMRGSPPCCAVATPVTNINFSTLHLRCCSVHLGGRAQISGCPVSSFTSGGGGGAAAPAQAPSYRGPGGAQSGRDRPRTGPTGVRRGRPAGPGEPRRVPRTGRSKRLHRLRFTPCATSSRDLCEHDHSRWTRGGGVRAGRRPRDRPRGAGTGTDGPGGGPATSRELRPRVSAMPYSEVIDRGVAHASAEAPRCTAGAVLLMQYKPVGDLLTYGGAVGTDRYASRRGSPTRTPGRPSLCVCLRILAEITGSSSPSR